MSIQEILNSEMTVSVTITADDLRTFVRGMVADVQAIEKTAKNEVYFTANQVCEYTGKVRSTLWTWEKRGYLTPSRIGKELRYSKSEIDLLMKGGTK